MTELHAWMTVIETAADEDTIPPEIIAANTRLMSRKNEPEI